MKTLFFLLITFSASAQMFEISHQQISIKADTMELGKAFKLLDTVLPRQIRYYSRVVYKDGVKYWQHTAIGNRLVHPKNTARAIIDGKRVTVKL